MSPLRLLRSEMARLILAGFLAGGIAIGAVHAAAAPSAMEEVAR